MPLSAVLFKIGVIDHHYVWFIFLILFKLA